MAMEDVPPGHRLGIHAGEEVLWLYEHHPREEGGHYLNFALRLKDQKVFVGPRDLRFLNKATVRAAAAVGDDLHVFYDTSHRRYAVTQQRLRLHSEQPLQGTPIPLAVAGHPHGGMLYALVSCATARKTLIRQREIQTGRTAARTETEDDDIPDELPAPLDDTLVDCQHVVLGYTPGQWDVTTVFPGEFDTGAAIHAIVDGDGVLHIITSSDLGKKHRIYHEGAWRDGPPVPEATLVGFVGDRTHIGLVARNEEVTVRWLTDDAWSEERVVAGGANNTTDVVATMFSDGLNMAALIEDVVSAGVWSDDGQTKVAWENVEALRTPVATHPRLRSFGAFGVMALLLGFVFWRRHDSVMVEIELPASYRVAGFGRRLVSFLVDFLIASVLTLPFAWYQPLSDWMQQYSALQTEATRPLVLSKGVIASWFIVCTAHVFYCIICEATFGSTPGKWLVGCRVLSENAGRPSMGQILVRNLLRYVELFPIFEWLPPLVLILFTRNRQRLGDLVARTVIVEHIAPARRRMSPSASDHDDGGPPAGM